MSSALKKSKGKVELTTVSTGKLTASLDKEKVKLTDKSDNSAYVAATDLKGSNGVIPVIEWALLPKKFPST